MKKQPINQQEEIMKIYASKLSSSGRQDRPASQHMPRQVLNNPNQQLKYNSIKASTNQGYNSKDLMKTEGRERHREVEDLHKAQQKSQHHQSNSNLLRQQTPTHYQGHSKLQNSYRPQTAVTSSRMMVNSNRRDHLQELFEKLQFTKKVPVSTYTNVYEFGSEFKEDVINHDFQYHYKRDRTTIYNEAMVRMKPHLRK
eukprot:403371408